MEIDFGVQRDDYMDNPYMGASHDTRSRVEEGQCGAFDPVPDRGPAKTRLRDFQTHRAALNGTVRFYVASLYPLLYRLERRGWIQGRWVEKSGQRRRRYYRLTSDGEKVLTAQRRGWKAFVEAVNRITEAEHA